MISAADPARGSTVFNRCKACHTVEEGGRHRVGSNLWSIVGKDIASAEGYNYTDAMIGVVTLERLLPSPHHKIIRSCSVQAQMLRVLAAMSRRVRLSSEPPFAARGANVRFRFRLSLRSF